MTTPRQLRVLLVTPRFAPYVGGIEHVVNELAGRLTGLGCHVSVLTTDLTGKLSRHESIGGVEIVRVQAYPRSRDYYFAPGIYRAIARAKGEWDLIHIHSYHTFVAPFAMLGALRAQTPYVLTFHGGGHSARVRRLMRPAQRFILRPLLRRAERLVAVARFEIELYSSQLRLPRDNFRLISNGSDLPRVVNAPPPGHGVVITSVGRLEKYKGHHRILASLPMISESVDDVRLVILGEGPYEGELRRQAQALGIADRVEYRSVPFGDRQAMAVALMNAALVVLLSEFETQPLAILEAAALGRPALVADTSGLSELARQGLATAVPLDASPSEVARAVVAALRSPVVPRTDLVPTWQRSAEEHLELYSSLLS